MKVTAIWNMALCSIGGKCCVHLESVLTHKMGAVGFPAVLEPACRTTLRSLLVVDVSGGSSHFLSATTFKPCPDFNELLI